MTRISSSLVMVFSLALVSGCANKNAGDTQNPDEVAGEGGGEQAGEGAGGEEGAAVQSRARGASTVRGSARSPDIRTIKAKKPARAKPEEAPSEEESGPYGLLAEAFSLADPAAGFPEDMAELGDVIDSFEVPNLDFDEIDYSNGFPGGEALKDNYAIRFSGSINVLAEAEYELCVHSDDGSQLLLEGMLVVDNSGVHDGAVEACELVYLAPGEYMLEVRYMQAGGPLLTMHMAWAIDGGDKEIIPADVLFKPVDSGTR